MSRSSDQHTVPRALIHTKILDAAADAPEASMEAIAAEVPSATTELVERVLDRYGDPAADENETPSGQDTPVGDDDESAVGQAESTTDQEAPAADLAELATDQEAPDVDVDELDRGDEERPTGPTETVEDPGKPPTEQPDAASEPDEPVSDAEVPPMAPDTPVPDAAELSPKQREVLEAIADRPDATQREIADQIGVSAPTVSNRANSIDGFEWARRRDFVADVFKSNGISGEQGPTNEAQGETRPMATNDTELAAAIDQLTARVDVLEDRLDDLEETDAAPAFGSDHELAHKVVHACLRSDTITEEEELRILEELLR